MGNDVSEWFLVNVGLRQGCVVLFNVYGWLFNGCLMYMVGCLMVV